MLEVIGVRFKEVGKIYYFSPGDLKIENGQGVIVETSRGIEFGMTELSNRNVPDEDAVLPLKKVMRIATENDINQQKINKEREQEALIICSGKVKEHKLDMKLIDVELAFDSTKIIFYFTSDGRVDFRGLVRDLASVFRMRIELRQIGVRDEAKILNGIGICGRTLCCATFLGDFQPVSIKMAKEQNLSLNPTKISGICGRLMCCLKYEEETYEYLTSNLPNIGDTISTDEGSGEVLSINILRQTVKASIKKSKNEVSVGVYPLEKIKIVTQKHQPKHAEKAKDSKLEELSD